MKTILLNKIIFTLIGLTFSACIWAQNTDRLTDRVWRLNIINPAIEYEHPIFNESALTVNLGVGMEGAYKNLAEDPSKPYYNYFMLAPYVDVKYKKIYNLDDRELQGKNTQYNSGNYFGARFLVRGPEIYSSFTRTDNFDFSFGPIWGLQRAYGKMHLQFDVGPMYYFDAKGNSGIFPVMIDLNFGFNL